MGYVDKNLMSGETILYRGKLHWAIFLTGFYVAVVRFGAVLLVRADCSGRRRISTRHSHYQAAERCVCECLRRSLRSHQGGSSLSGDSFAASRLS